MIARKSLRCKEYIYDRYKLCKDPTQTLFVWFSTQPQQIVIIKAIVRNYLKTGEL